MGRKINRLNSAFCGAKYRILFKKLQDSPYFFQTPVLVSFKKLGVYLERGEGGLWAPP
jgi:hypothetical protein